MVKSFYALLAQESLFIEGEGRYILAESVRDRISEQGTKTGGNAVDDEYLPPKYPPSTPQVPPKCPPSLKQIVQTLHKSKQEMPRNDLQKALQMKDKRHFVKEYLQPALESGLIEMTIPDKPRSGKQKYRLTELGRSVAEGMK